jgi:hypothetical protein
MAFILTNVYWGGARVADWARLLSECWGSSAAGSNPALPASNDEGLRNAGLFVISRGPRKGIISETRPPRQQ